MVNTGVDLLLLFLFFVPFFSRETGTVFIFVPSLPTRILHFMSLVSLCFDKKGPQFVMVMDLYSAFSMWIYSNALYNTLWGTLPDCFMAQFTIFLM